MLSIWTVGSVIAIYLLALFLLAFWGEKRLQDNQQHPILYSLGLGVHCTSWAFFGTASQAAQYGWAIIPTYLGIILTMAFAFPVILRISRLCQQHNVSSLADLIGLKYKNAHLLAAFITLLSFVGVIPYIALQLDAITKSINLITPDTQNNTEQVGLYVAGLMTIFAIVFGTRTLNLTDKHPGLLLTIAVESLIKLVALSVIGIFVCFYLFDGVFDLFTQAATNDAARQVIYADRAPWVYLSHVLLGVCSMFVLPRQFHMNFIELNGEGELKTARWLFPLYLVGMTIFLIPIALAGKILLAPEVTSDTYVLSLPLHSNNIVVSVTAFIGGLSATTSMIIVATLALGVMISNNLITPLWLKVKLRKHNQHSMKPKSILLIRRLTVLVVLSIALWYHLNVSQSAPLVNSGTIAIALLGQCLPILLFGLYWHRSTKIAAFIGLGSGFICWLVFLLYPSLLSSYYFNPPPSDGDLGKGFAIALAANCMTFVITSLLTYTPSQTNSSEKDDIQPELSVRIADLMTLTKRVLSEDVHRKLVNQLSASLDTVEQHGYASHSLLKRAEQLMSAQVGGPSARILLGTIAQTGDDNLPVLVDWVEEASQSFQFNHEVLQSSVQHIKQGICVLDEQLNLLAWNERYVELFDYPKTYLQAGMPIASVLAYNAKRGLFGDGSDVSRDIEKRIQFMKEGHIYKHVRRQTDGKVVELNGSPLPAGGYVTTYSDITEYIAIQEALQEAKTALEARVEQRTLELQLAKQEADKANESKTKFLAAAGHDLMQPFNAATLFAAMLAKKTKGSELATLSDGVVNSLNSAESLLSMLLDMTKLDSGVLKAQVTHFDLNDVLQGLVAEFNVIAQQKGLELRYVKTSVSVTSDKKLLRRVIQNLISNAIRYTSSGTVLIGVRRSDSTTITLFVYDTGPGIPEDQQTEIFNEFHQLSNTTASQGLGLGLTIVERFCHLLAHQVSVTSQVGKGSGFSVTLPRSLELQKSVQWHPTPQSDDSKLLADKRVLLVENDAQITQAMYTLLSEWGATVFAASSVDSALEQCPVKTDIVIADYHLDYGETGIDVVKALHEQWGSMPLGILITANRSEGIRDEATENELYYLSKPLKPAALKRLIKSKLK